MKQKTCYILLVVCCMSLFSAAKQSGRKCDCRSSSSVPKTKTVPSATGSGYDLSPISFIINL
ncbi:MAG: hypothetical protein H7Y42_13285 [Chitinophagaceae bacterium]|nr:hypothetical protein [Chitinophagaceae bacterium]